MTSPDKTPAIPRGPQHSALSTRFADALRYLAEFVDLERGGVAASVLGLDRIRALLDALDRPQERYPSVLIAGTKGKGSTAAMVERALRVAGYRTGLYTQPHLHTIRERVRIDGEPVTEDAFGSSLDAVRHAVEQVCTACGPVTAYEVVTALALDHFAQVRVDVAVLEVGLGGRLDATNVVEAQVSAITSISLDHTQILGDTVEAIAGEKADIIKVGRPCVSAPQPAGAFAAIRAVAAQRAAPLRVAEADGARWEGADLLTSRGRLADLHPALVGDHQRINAAVAASILDALHEQGRLVVPLEAVRAGIETVEWAGRFEVVAEAPPVVLDGAHNVESAERLRATLAQQYPGLPIFFVLGVAADKDVDGIIRALAPAQLVVATQSQHPRAVSPTQIAALAAAAGYQAVTAPTVPQALATAREVAGPTDVVVATGSLYVVAEAREALSLAVPSGEANFNPWGAR